MKNIIILGAPRCGKSTLSQMLIHKFHYQVIRIDALRNSLDAIYPELSINSKTAIKNKRFQNFIYEYFKKNTTKNHGYILEGCDISVEDCLHFYKDENNIILFLISEQQSPEILAKTIREHDQFKDWTYKLTNQELVNCTKDIIAQSKIIKEKCEQYNLQYFVTSFDRDHVLDQIMKVLEKQIFN